MASLTRWTWVWASSRCWWWIGKPGVLQSIGLQRVWHDWEWDWTELNWTECLVIMNISSCTYLVHFIGFPGGINGKELICQCRRLKRCSFNPWISKISQKRAWQSTPVFLAGESCGQTSLVGNDWSNLAFMHILLGKKIIQMFYIFF